MLDGKAILGGLTRRLDPREYYATDREVEALARAEGEGNSVGLGIYLGYKGTRAESDAKPLALTDGISDNAAMSAEHPSLLVNKISRWAFSDAGFYKRGVVIIGNETDLLTVGSVPRDEPELARFFPNLLLRHIR